VSISGVESCWSRSGASTWPGLARPLVSRLARCGPWERRSAGQTSSGKTRKGHRALRTGLTPLAHAAALTKGTYVSALYHRLAARRGKKRAIMAVAHSIVSVPSTCAPHEPSHE